MRLSCFNLASHLSKRISTVLFTAALMMFTGFSLPLLTANNAFATQSKAAPEFVLPSINGNKSLEEYRGQYLYVDFWASWCGPCRQSFPWMNQMRTKYQAQGLNIIAINLDEHRVDADQFLQSVRADVDIAFDASGTTAEAFNVMGMPSSYLINPEGEIVFSHIGFRTRDTAQLEAEIAKLIGG